MAEFPRATIFEEIFIIPFVYWLVGAGLFTWWHWSRAVIMSWNQFLVQACIVFPLAIAFWPGALAAYLYYEKKV